MEMITGLGLKDRMESLGTRIRSRQALILTGYAIAALALTTVSGCSSSKRGNPDCGFSQYIEAYTGGIIGNGSAIVVELAAPVTGMDGTESEICRKTTGLFSFSPSLDGTAHWTSPERVEFIPAEGALKDGHTYTCSFALGKVTTTDKSHRTFRFSFVTAQKESSLKPGTLIIMEESREAASYSGTLSLSESLGSASPADLLAFSYPESGAILETELAEDGRHVNFTVTGLTRTERDNILSVRFKPGNTGFRGCQPLKVTIPAKDEHLFRVMDAVMPEGADGCIDITFSEPLDSRQNPDGLISIAALPERYVSGNGEILKLSWKATGNVIRLYFGNTDRQSLRLHVSEAIRDCNGDRLGETWEKTFSISNRLPQAGFPAEGNILPDPEHLVIPFTAVNLKAVDVSVIKIFPNNILMFLQDNDMNGDSGLRRAGRLVYRHTVRLDGMPDRDLTKAGTYSLDLSNLFVKDPDAIYRIRLSFKRDYYIYYHDDSSERSSLVSTSDGQITEEDQAVWDEPNPYYYDLNYDWNEYSWKDRNNPLTLSYYMDYDFPTRNLMTTGIGVTAKMAEMGSGNGSIWVSASDILTGKPVGGADIRVYNYQLQETGKGHSSSDGLAEIIVKDRPFALKVSRGSSVTYLKMTDGNEKSLSRFDTGGATLQKGMKAYIYGERGVWRPGNTLHLNMILHPEDKIPASHPVIMDVYTPQGQFYARKICNNSENGFHTFELPITSDSPTGIWNAYFKVGGATFHKALRIESIKPNRLKVNIDMGKERLESASETKISLSSSWLTGPAASGLDARVEMTLKPGHPDFKAFNGYTFTNPASKFESFTTGLLETRLDASGKASATVILPKADQAPGMLSANITGAVMEEGGDESWVSMTLPFSPFKAYIGMKLPAGDESWFETGKKYEIPVAVVDADGKRVSGHHIDWRIFKLKWSWWWESEEEPLDSYVNASAAIATSSGTAISGNEDIMIPFSARDDEWGRYLIYAKDIDSGHACGGIVYADWPSYIGRSDRQDPDAPAMLTFSLDRKSYMVGDMATVYIPAADEGRALVSIENGSRVIAGKWVKCSGTGDTPYRIRITEDMAPNFYVHITLVQPYMNSSNDLPLRMYGVQPVMVENPGSHLYPVISMPDRIEPEKEFTVMISERNGKPMTYTLAIVDEGLLDLTAFKTPDPWNGMYRRTALGIRTWDMYDNVFGADGGTMAAMFSIGGDIDIISGSRKENRFNPVVRTLGPFTLKSGSRSHKITLPMYLGSVRVMAVAGYDGAYGNAEKTVPVTSPLMILPTMPRAAGSGERITLPVNVFVTEDGISSVKVSVKCSGPLKLESSSCQSIAFSGKGDKMARFSLVASSGERPDTSRVTITAEGGGHKIAESIDIEVRNPSPSVISLKEAMLGKGESREFTWTAFKETWKDKAWLEASTYPSIDWDGLFSFFRDYRYSCTEQLAAKGLSLLYAMPNLSEQNASSARTMIPEILSELYSRQLADGGFAYWPGESHSNEWITSMAGEFMTMASAGGYDVNSGVLASWKRYQSQCVQNWRTAKVYKLGDLVQAYRLYSLALAQSPDEAAMNRLKESGNLSWQGAMMLASGYSLCGKKSVGHAIMESITAAPEKWTASPWTYTYGTRLRDKAIAVEALIRTGNVEGAASIATELCGEESGSWPMSTQESVFMAKATSLLSMNMAGKQIDMDVKYLGSSGDDSIHVKSEPASNGLARASINPETGGIKVTNNSDGAVYVRVTTISQNAPGSRTSAMANRLGLTVRYVGADGEEIDPSSLKQGTEFTAIIKTSNPDPMQDYENMALVQMIPSGWEIINGRMTEQDVHSAVEYDYLDIRDDRNLFYFNLPRSSSKEFKVRLRAAYEGEYALPAITCEAMYNSAISACTASGRAIVTRDPH